MRASYRSQTKRPANRKDMDVLGADIHDSDADTYAALQDEFRRLFRFSLPEITTADLADITKMDRRQATRIMARQQIIYAFEAVWRLLRSKHGPKVHRAILDNLRTEWAQDLLRQQSISEAERDVRNAEQRLKNLRGGA